MKGENMLYILYHYYEYEPGNPDTVLILESNKTKKEIVEIYSSLQFLLETLMGNDCPSLDMKCLQSILIDYYGMINKKDMIKPSSYEDVELFENCLPEEQVVEQKDGTFRNVCIIELFGAREHCCGDHYREIMNRWLPYGKQLEQLKHRICVQGTNTLKGIYPNVKINEDKKEKINLIESKFSNYEIKSYQSIPRNYVDENIIRTVQDQIEQFSKYLDEIKLCIMKNEENQGFPFGDSSMVDEMISFKEVDKQVKALKNGLFKLQEDYFHHESFKKMNNIKRDTEIDLETEQLILMYPKYKLREMLQQEDHKKNIYNVYTKEQIQKALENYDKEEFRKKRQKLKSNKGSENFLSVALNTEIECYGTKEDYNNIRERIRKGLEYYGIDVRGKIKIDEKGRD